MSLELASRCDAANETPTASATMPPTASMAMTIRSSTSDRGCEERVDALDLRLQLFLVDGGNGSVDVDLVVDAHPAAAAAVRLGHGDRHRPGQSPCPYGDHVDGLIGTELVARVERGAVHGHERLEAVQRVEIAHLPGAHDFRPMRDRHVRRLPATRVV